MPAASSLLRLVRLRLAACALASLALSACTALAPVAEIPPLPVADAWPSATDADADADTEAGARAAAELPWQAYFTDARLQRLIALALENNRDLRVAALRVDEARAVFGIERASRFPELGVGASAARARVPGDLNPSGQALSASEYRAEALLSTWELDLWGRLRRLEEAALQSWLATDAARQAVRLALITTVADAWLGVRELDERVAIARQSVSSHQHSYRIFQRRFEVGATSKLDLTQVQTLLSQAQALLTRLEQARAAQLHALAVLLGTAVDEPTLAAALEADAAAATPAASAASPFAQLQAGLPSEVLTRRPDIIAAEHRLRARAANIGAARAAFLPRIALTASLGSASAELDGLFASGSRAWTFVPVVSLPILDGGRRRAALAASEVRRDIAVAEYEQALQTAFREVADALSARKWLGEQLRAAQVLHEAQRERARLAQLRYEHGSTAYLEVLDAQRDLLEAAQQLAQTRRALHASEVALYAALGGGTQAADASAALPSSAAIR